MKLTLDNTLGNRHDSLVEHDATIELASQQLDLLDGKNHTLLMLEREDGVQMLVGGGRVKFVVTLASEDDNCYVLNNAQAVNVDTNEVELCAGGQYADFPLKNVVEKIDAYQAVEYFYKRTEMELSWSST